MSTPPIMYEDVKVTPVQVTMFRVTDNGRPYRTEHEARLAASTHHRCECGEPARNYSSCCRSCRQKLQAEEHAKREAKPWDGKTPLYSHACDRWFMHSDELLEYLDDNQVEWDDLQLVWGKRSGTPSVDFGVITEDYSDEDGEAAIDETDEISKAIDTLNSLLKQNDRGLWQHTKIAATKSNGGQL